MGFSKVLLAFALIALIAVPALAKAPAKQKVIPDAGSTALADRDLFEGFEGDWPPDGWTVVSHSGHSDVENWYHGDAQAHEGSFCAKCQWDPDMIPQDNDLSFEHEIEAGGEFLNFWIAGNNDWRDHYDVTVLIDGTQVYSWSDAYGTNNWAYENHSIDLTAYIGQTVTVTYKFVGTDTSAIFLDAIEFSDSGVIPPEPPVNDTCDGAIVIDAGPFAMAGDLTLANNDYDPLNGGCTFYAAAGQDVAYSAAIDIGAMFTVSVLAEHDGSIYLVTDCGDVVGSCLVGADDTMGGQAEVIVYTNNTGAVVHAFLIVDAYNYDAGEFTMTGQNGVVVATESATFSRIKASYR